MNFVKDLMLCALFTCMLGVLLLFVQLNNELHSSAAQHDVIINAQVKVISEDMVLIRKQNQEIDELKSELIDLKELYFVLVKRFENKEETVKFLKGRLTRVYENYQKLQKTNEELKRRINAQQM